MYACMYMYLYILSQCLRMEHKDTQSKDFRQEAHSDCKCWVCTVCTPAENDAIINNNIHVRCIAFRRRIIYVQEQKFSFRPV